MRLQFLGTGGYHPNERRHTNCLWLPESGTVFDAGTAAFRLQSRLVTDELRIFLTHAHLDHIVGLTYLIVPFLTGQLKAATVYAAASYLEEIQKHLFAPAIFGARPGFVYQELPPTVELADGGLLTHCPLRHPGGSTGYRIDWPAVSDAGKSQPWKSLAYITDTTCSPDYLEFIRGVDVLIHECNFPDAMAEWAYKTGHSHLTPVAELARAAGVGKLILTHLDPQHPEDDPIGIEAARSIFRESFIAEDLQEIEF